MSTPSEYHRRRAEIEMDKALCAGEPMAAIAHLELARLHREKRAGASAEAAAPVPGAYCFDRADKEG